VTPTTLSQGTFGWPRGAPTALDALLVPEEQATRLVKSEGRDVDAAIMEAVNG
jgi:hypothetical protein